jgi:hypothetical protein
MAVDLSQSDLVASFCNARKAAAVFYERRNSKSMQEHHETYDQHLIGFRKEAPTVEAPHEKARPEALRHSRRLTDAHRRQPVN